MQSQIIHRSIYDKQKTAETYRPMTGGRYVRQSPRRLPSVWVYTLHWTVTHLREVILLLLKLHTFTDSHNCNINPLKYKVNSIC